MEAAFKRGIEFANRLLFLAASLLQTASMLYLILLIAFGWGNQRIIYWLTINSQSERLIGIGLLVFLGVGILFVVLTILSWLFVDRKRSNTIGAKAALLAFLATPFLCGAYFVSLWQVGGPLGVPVRHVSSTQAGDHIYHLAFYSYDPAEGYNDYYYLYECDSLDLLCQEIYSIARTTGGITRDVEDITLVPDAETNIISVQVNGEIVYVHRP